MINSNNQEQQDYFSKIPNRFFYSTKEDEKSIYHICKDDKALLVLDYLYINTNRKNIVNFTLEHLVRYCGFSKDKAMNNKLIDILYKLADNNIITFKEAVHIIEVKIEEDTKTQNKETKTKKTFDIKNKETCSITISIDLDKNFMILYEKEKNLILKQQLEKTDNVKLLVYYCYLKARMYKRSSKEGSVDVSGGRAEITWVSYETISFDLFLTDQTIKKYNDILVKLDLIRIGSAGNWYYQGDRNKVVRESCNIYTLFEGDENRANKNIKEGIKYYKNLEVNKNKVFTNSKNYKNNNRKLNGELGAIIKKEKNGKATEEDLIRKSEIIDSINADAELFKIKALLEANPDSCLWEVFDNLCKEESSEYWYEIEIGLGLINDDNELLIDRQYYEWVLTNYSKDQEEKLINSVKKHKRECPLENNEEKNTDNLGQDIGSYFREKQRPVF